MIRNIPKASDLELASLNLYFRAWSEVTQIIRIILDSPLSGAIIINGKIEVRGSADGLFSKDDCLAEFNDILTRSQSDLALSHALIQQSQELALKALICAENPFLLLLGSDTRLWAKKNGDFTDFRTLDAADLPRVISAISTRQLSERFVRDYHLLRKGRNRFTHLGSTSEELDPMFLIDTLVRQYAELYSARSWMKDRLYMLSIGANSHLYDKRINETLIVLDEIVEMELFLTHQKKRTLLGFCKTDKVYRCLHCHDEAREGDYLQDQAATAILSNGFVDGTSELVCHLCQKTTRVTNKTRCAECHKLVVSQEPGYEAICCYCGFDTNHQD